MAMLPGSFNSDNHEDMGSFDPIPKDKYLMMIEDSEIKPTKKALEERGIEAQESYTQDELNGFSGLRLNLKAKVVGGQYDGRGIFIGLNIKNPNPQAVEISQKELATICRAVGKTTIKDSSELHSIPFIADVGIKAASANYDASNVIKGYEKFDGATIPSGSQGEKPAGEASPKNPAKEKSSGGNKKKPGDE